MSQTKLNQAKTHHYFCATEDFKKYECLDCKYSTNLKVHFAKHRSSFCLTKQQQYVCASRNLEKYTCSECDYSTDFKVCLLRHEYKSKEEIKTYTCQKCKIYNSSSLLLLTKHEHNKCRLKKYPNFIPVLYKCVHCPFESRHPSLVRSHSVRLHSSKEICCKCQYCGHQIKTPAGMRYHISGQHLAGKDRTWYECVPCGFKTGMRENYYKHINYHTSKSLRCTKCSYVTKTRFNLSRHTRGKHSEPEQVTWMRCDTCAFKTKWPSGLKRHVKLNRCGGPAPAPRRFECGHCALRTTTKRNLESHIVARHLKPQLVCKDEVRRREEKELLKTAEKRFECHECGFRTTKRRFLLRHVQLAHVPPERIKWFECELCFFRTKLKGNLTKHVKNLHTAPEDIDWKRCGLCDYKAKRKASLRAHLAKKHGDYVGT